MIKNCKILIAHSWVLIIGSSVLFANCEGNSYSCFKYDNSPIHLQPPQQGFMSYKKLEDGLFGSLDGFDGQYVPKGGLGYLGVLNLNSTLALDNVFNHDVFYILSEGGENTLRLNSKTSTIIGNIEITSLSLQEEAKNIASLSFDGNRAISKEALLKFEKEMKYSGRRKPSIIFEAKYENDRQWAMVGGISNSSRNKLTLDFKNGAKMLGDLYANHSQIFATFHFSNATSSNLFSYPFVFEGGIYNAGGKIDLKVESGGIKVCSIGLENHGILAENGGINTIVFGGREVSRPQYLFSSQIIANTDVPNIAQTKNFITFKNAQGSEGNFISVYDVIADSAQNVLQTMDLNNEANTQANVLIERVLISTHNPKSDYKEKVGNTIIIDGGLKVGEYAIRTLGGNDEMFGIMAWSGVNTIKLKDTLSLTDFEGVVKTSEGGYDEERMLITPRIYAGASRYGVGKNDIEIDGDLKLMYLQTQEGRVGAEIIATDGGSNTIVVNGVIDVIKYRTRLGDPLGVFVNEESKREEKDLFNTLIGVYGNNPSTKNTLVFKNTDLGNAFNGSGMSDLILGDIVAYGGSNDIVLHAPLSEDWMGVEIGNLVAGNTDLEGRKYIGGVNHLMIANGMDIIIKKIHTQVGGANHLWILQNGGVNDMAQISDLGIVYGEGGETSIHFGIGESKDTLSSAIKMSLDSWGGEKSLNLSVSKNSEENFETYGVSLAGAFFGSMQYIKTPQKPQKSMEVNYALEEGAIFVGEIGGDIGVDQSIFIGSGAKFVPRSEGKISFEALVMDTSATQEQSFLKNTISMNSTIIDLATSGGSFSQILGRSTSRALNVDTFIIHENGKSNPLIRYYIPSTNPQHSDRLIVREMSTNALGLEAQIFLPTKLIGYDFSDDDIVIFSTQKGGEDLEITSKIAQTGFTTYTTEILKETKNNPADTQMLSHFWKLGKSKDVVISPDFINFAGMVLTHNYGTFHIHFNSLNKRMGELREDKNAHGFWGRGFGGEQVSLYGYSEINSKYFVFQGGYDRSFELGEGEDFVGVMLSYGVMDSSSKPFVGTYLDRLSYGYNAFSHSGEIGAYNVYSHQNGFYTDSIAKVGYILTNFNGINENSISTHASNFTFALGQEVGYQFRFGKDKEWFATPQIEVTLGYLTQSSIEQEYNGQTLHSMLEGVLTLRNRLGSEFGYSLRGSKAQFDFKIGLSYVFDYANADAFCKIVGGEYIKGVTLPSLISSDQKMALNLGTNVRLGKNVRLYFDMESSFFGKINTKYQVNAGIRYSFGERVYLPTPYDRAKENYTKLIAQ